MPDKTKFKYERLPYKEDEMKPIEEKDNITLSPEKTAPNKMQGSPFKLGSNRGNNSYSGFQAKGLITPIQNKEGEKEKKTDNLQDNYQNYTEQDMKEGKIRAGKAAAIAAAKAGKTKFKYGGSSYTIPQDILAQYSK